MLFIFKSILSYTVWHSASSNCLAGLLTRQDFFIGQKPIRRATSPDNTRLLPPKKASGPPAHQNSLLLANQTAMSNRIQYPFSYSLFCLYLSTCFCQSFTSVCVTWHSLSFPMSTRWPWLPWHWIIAHSLSTEEFWSSHRAEKVMTWRSMTRTLSVNTTINSESITP